MNKKVISDQIFNSYQNQSIHAIIHQISVVTSAFDKDKIFHLHLNKLEYNHPIGREKSIGLEKIELKRTTYENLKNPKWKELSEN
jgi:hypothetical protein